ncbi:dolichol kinase [Methanocella sp. CWC-04]|uniref:Dolichol kinase n=1 Tax=Methanooceanicella nereidis TaxID=2052831 RepID=A0AAP2RBQ7_9EURY|nr:dolichol kinase [Methanocella sp. CWC-04]MCD1294543.1 dolichol kinase [Methanocella sp. CWC-04]
MPFDKDLFLKEVSRKSIHASGFFIPLLYYFFIPRDIMIIFLGIAVAVAFVLEAIRLSGISIFPGILLRGHEEKGTVAAYFYALLSTFIAVLVFEKNIAVAALLFLDIGDALTGLAGAVLSMYRGNRKAAVRTYDTKPGKNIFKTAIDDITYSLKNFKSPILMAVMFTICFSIAILFYPAITVLAAAAGAIGAVIADAFPWRILGFTIDDNLAIPLLSGAFMTLVMMI